MSRKNNVNPDHYKIAGRDRPSDDVVRKRAKSNLSRNNAKGMPRKRSAEWPRQRNENE